MTAAEETLAALDQLSHRVLMLWGTYGAIQLGAATVVERMFIPKDAPPCVRHAMMMLGSLPDEIGVRLEELVAEVDAIRSRIQDSHKPRGDG